jgi:signal transduction histidine kinase
VLGLRKQVIVAFGALSLLVAVVVSLVAYGFARSYLISQRESSALTRAFLDARAVGAALDAGTAPGDALAQVPAVGDSQALARVEATWFTRGVTVSPTDLPQSLLDQAVTSGAAQQRFAVDGLPFYGVAVYSDGRMYLELFPVDDLEQALRQAAWVMAGLSGLAFVLGAGIGGYAGGRLMRPLRSMSDGAGRIADGDLTARLETSGDPDLDPLSSAFNDMADAVEQRIARERRLVANVSHELRSPVTTVLGTAELLERHRDQMPTRDASLVAGLAGQSRRLSQTLVDLLELGSVTAGAPVQLEGTDVAALLEDLLRARGLEVALLRGDRPLVRTDGRRVERVLGNFLDNAVRHGGGVQQVTIEQDAGAVLVHVDDGGPGLLAGDDERIFEPFVRGSVPAEGAREGAGLGLAIAREHAEVIGARVMAEGSPAGGARFTLRLPAGTT